MKIFHYYCQSYSKKVSEKFKSPISPPANTIFSIVLMYFLIQSVNIYLEPYSVPGTILDPGDIAVEKTDFVGKTKKKK